MRGGVGRYGVRVKKAKKEVDAYGAEL